MPLPSSPRRTRAAVRTSGRKPRTLAIDVGGTGLKAVVLDPAGAMVSDRVRVPTPYPLTPRLLVSTLRSLVRPLPAFDRVSVGFPGVVRDGRVLSAPEFVAVGGSGTAVDSKLVAAWHGNDLAAAIGRAFRRPARVANDADMQGAAVIKGRGVELVITLGTGVGTALFENGRLAPHLEFAQHPFRKGQTYNEQLGEAARERLSKRKWNRRVRIAIDTLDRLAFFDHVYIGGGNSAQVSVQLGPKASIVDNSAGLLGGIKLWEPATGHR